MYGSHERVKPSLCIYHETGSETPAGNMQLQELNIALLYLWVYYNG